ncbi:hypothetical protein R1flu_002609 [Riccia fluitans]|uniref:Uncharacterized protein n=1 Tax=Riccia fluitans TaxID=41844 RepID=A0ABD1Y7L7_9MARC
MPILHSVGKSGARSLIPIQNILKRALDEVEAVAHRFNPDSCGSWKENKDAIVRWIGNSLDPSPRSSLSDSTPWDGHSLDDTGWESVQNQIEDTWSGGPSVVIEALANHPPSNLVSDNQMPVPLTEDTNQSYEPSADLLLPAPYEINSRVLHPPVLHNQETSQLTDYSRNSIRSARTKEVSVNHLSKCANSSSTSLPPSQELHSPNLHNQDFVHAIESSADKLPNRAEPVMSPPLARIVLFVALSELLTHVEVSAEFPRGQNRSPVANLTRGDSSEEWWGSHKPP